MAVYLVEGPDDNERLVDAANGAQARNHVTRDLFKVGVAKPADIARICRGGGDIETVGEAAPLGTTEQITSMGNTGGPGSEDYQPPADDDTPPDDAPPEEGRKRGK